MDKVNQYEQIICEVLGEYAQRKKPISPDVQTHLIIDREHKHYQLLMIGWHKEKYIYTLAFHFTIQQSKVWIQQNNTEVLIAVN